MSVHTSLKCMEQTLIMDSLLKLDSLVSTYVVCERLSVNHEPAGVVEILVQILQFTPIL